jgi:ATP-binding cassette subfamily F protein uup
MVLAERPNVLLLDEPTNDLDLDTLRVLEDFLEDWPGTLVVVSHDRTFMDRSVSEVFALEGGRAALVNGGYAGWRAQRDAAAAAAGANPSSTGVAAEKLRTPTNVAVAHGPKKRSASTLRVLLKEADKELARAAKRRDAAQQTLDSAVTSGDHAAMAAAGATLADAQHAVDAAEESWLEIAAESEAT